MNKCLACGIEFEGRKDAKFCSPKCRVTFSRKQSIVTDNVTFSEPDVTLNFEFTVPHKANKIRTAVYWYDVPLAAVPVLHDGWPAKPDYMNGRQYFLWWKNDFKTGKDGEPVIHNPFPKYDNLKYELAGEGSRRWGA